MKNIKNRYAKGARVRGCFCVLCFFVFLFPFQRFFAKFTGFVACTGRKDQLGADYGTPGHQLPCPKSPNMH